MLLFPSSRRRFLVRPAAALLILAGASVASRAPAAASDPLVAPVTNLSADGRTVTDGQRTLTVSQTSELEPDGATVAVAGSGYDERKGIYLALCVVPPRNVQPSPCGGGADIEGTQNAAHWISSNPPPSGLGLATPYGPSGSFSVTIRVRSQISPGVDCRQVRCAIVSRNDHTRTADRSQDLLIPVSFRTGPPPSSTAPSPTVGQASTTSTAAGPSTTLAPPPPPPSPTTTTTTVVTDDGRAVTDGTRHLAVDRAEALDPDRDRLEVRGGGFDDAHGVFVQLCALGAGGEIGPCLSGTAETTRWISSDPPPWGAGRAIPYADGGGFAVQLQVAALIDDGHDCRSVPCAIVARPDDPEAAITPLALPVSFSSTTTATDAEATSGERAGAVDTIGASDAPRSTRRIHGWMAGAALALTLMVPFGIRRLRARPFVQRRLGARAAVCEPATGSADTRGDLP